MFIVIFLASSGAFTFYLGNIFQRGQADLQSFFQYHPWLYLFLIPAVAMRLWSEERKTGTIELLMTLPVSTTEAVLGKFLAAWAFIAIALVLTFPIWLTVNYLGDPDNGIIVASYVGSLVMAGSYLAIGACCFGVDQKSSHRLYRGRGRLFSFPHQRVGNRAGVLPQLGAAVRGRRHQRPSSFLTHFSSVTRGVIDLKDVIFFGSVIGIALYVNVAFIEIKKGA